MGIMTLQSMALDASYSDQFQYLLRTFGSGPNFKDSQGRSFLHNAIINNDIESVKELLLDADIDVNTQDNEGNTPLHFAVLKDNNNIIIELLGHKPRLDLVNNLGQTSLDVAIINNLNDVIPLLIKAGAKINSFNRDGMTPLHIAAINNNVQALLLLLDASTLIDVQDRNLGNTPLHFAILNDATEAVRILLNAGADISIVNKDGNAAQEVMTMQQIWNNKKMNNMFMFAALPRIKDILEERRQERAFNNQVGKIFTTFVKSPQSSKYKQGPLV